MYQPHGLDRMTPEPDWILRLRQRQERIARPLYPWDLKDWDAIALLERGYWLVATGLGLHIESLS